MRKDKGLNGDLDRLPMLTWIMFLKRIEEGRAELAGKAYRSIIEAPYRWRDWAADADGITGPDLLSFLVSEMTERPDGTRGPGLFAYLRGLRGDNGRRERRDVIATVFQGFANRMESGYLLRDVVNLIDGISTRRRKSTPSAAYTRRCCVRCATLPGTRASSTRPGRSCDSWSR
jgi:type I restriction enzyme M protein